MNNTKYHEFIKHYMQIKGCSEQYADAMWFTLDRDTNATGKQMAERVRY